MENGYIHFHKALQPWQMATSITASPSTMTDGYIHHRQPFDHGQWLHPPPFTLQPWQMAMSIVISPSTMADGYINRLQSFNQGNTSITLALQQQSILPALQP